MQRYGSRLRNTAYAARLESADRVCTGMGNPVCVRDVTEITELTYRRLVSVLAVALALVFVQSQARAQYPLPDPGETVAWTPSMNPIQINGTVVVVAGGTVNVEPGVIIDVATGSTLQIDGSLIGTGTVAVPIKISGDDFSFSPAVRVVGTLELEHAIASGLLHGRSTGTSSVLVTRCSFTEGGVSTSGGFLKIDQCTFTDGARVQADTATLVMHDSTILGQSPTPSSIDDRLSIRYSYLHLNNVTLDGSQFSFIGGGFVQPPYINNLTVKNNVEAGGLELWDGNYFIGSNVVVENNLYTATMWGTGLMPGSTLPPTGNINNWLLNAGDGDRNGRLIWADAGVPYVLTGGYAQRGGSISIRPGATVKLGPDAGMRADPAYFEARGLPGNPVTFERLDPARPWQFIHLFDRFENCVIDGGLGGARFSSGNVKAPGYIDNSIITNCELGMQNHAYVRKTQFINNGTAVWGNGIAGDMDGSTNPNSFTGNGLAIHEADNARFNWWGDPSGPTAPQNPGGSGDPVNNGVAIDPFLATPPNFSDNPPIVNLHRPYFIAQVGDQLLVSWESTDDGAIASHRVLFKPRGGEPFQVVVDNLPGNARSVEIAIPDIPRTNLNGPAFIRVEAVDDAGQVGWDQSSADIPWPTTNTGVLEVTSNLTGPFTAGQKVPLCYSVGGGAFGTISAFLVTDGDASYKSLGGGHTGMNCLPLGLTMPFMSTDTARIMLVLNVATNERKYFFSDYFTIRPDARVGDAAPNVQLLTPAVGAQIRAGAVASITWTASDDEALRSFTVQASYDAGLTWQPIADNLSASARRFDWRVPGSDGIAEARVRVIARDLRFQNSSDGGDRALQILPGQGCFADCDGSGALDIFDFLCFQNSFVNGQSYACDCDTTSGPGVCDIFDFLCFQNAFVAGCP